MNTTARTLSIFCSVLVVLLFFSQLCLHVSSAFTFAPSTNSKISLVSTKVLPMPTHPSHIDQHQQIRPLYAAPKSDNDNDEEKDENIDLEKEIDQKLQEIGKMGDDLMKLGDQVPTSSTNGNQNTTPKLGIDIGSQLQPLSDEEAAELRAAATELINDGFAEGLDEIEKLRKQMKESIQKQQQQMNFASEMQLQKEQTRLLNKIDQMTNDFLDKTKDLRQDTKLAAKADQSMEGKGVEMGVWGSIGGAAVVTKGAKHVGLLGSVGRAKFLAEREAKKANEGEMADLKKSFHSEDEEQQEESAAQNNNLVLIVADPSQVS